jgi:glucose/arabinose dehydrogenase
LAGDYLGAPLRYHAGWLEYRLRRSGAAGGKHVDRLLDIATDSDGLIYVLSDSGNLLRLVPAPHVE